MAEKIENRQESVPEGESPDQQNNGFLPGNGEDFALSLDELIRQVINHHIGFDALA